MKGLLENLLQTSVIHLDLVKNKKLKILFLLWVIINHKKFLKSNLCSYSWINKFQLTIDYPNINSVELKHLLLNLALGKNIHQINILQFPKKYYRKLLRQRES